MVSNVLADTSGIIALLDESDRHHKSVLKIVESYDILIPFSLDRIKIITAK